ncbi:MAG TPA: hemolysin family protein [Blastocatellia bacterium]|nr:hemolysin family protein [Blastocatellia bacterium]
MEGSSLSHILIKLAVVLLLALANGFFVASEFALVSVRRSRIAALVADGNKRARTVMRVIEHLDAFISATQLGITLASLALGWIGEQTLAELFTPVFHAILPGTASEIAAHSVAVAVAFAAITYLHIVLGELAPKTLALERAERVALIVARPMEVFYTTFKAPIWLLNHSGNLVLRLLGLKASTQHVASYSEEELRHLIALSHKSGHLIEDERQLISNVFDFTEATVESVMVPRTEIEAVDASLDPVEMLNLFEDTGYSRMPVFRESLDDIIGILLHKDLSRVVRRGGAVDLQEIMRPPVFLPTSVMLNDALRRLRRSSEHMALVVDEHGGVEGLVTLEDLLEEIVGDIRDEHDDAAVRQIVEQPDGSFNVKGNLSIRDANKRLELGLPESDSYHTIAGFMMARAGRILRPGESVEYSGLRLTVLSAQGNRIVDTRIERVADQAATAPSATT